MQLTAPTLSRAHWLWIGLLAAGFSGMVCLLEADRGFNPMDESFLWYGAQRVVAGEVPIRDFYSYDPGRYYWSAAWMALWNDTGIVNLRTAGNVFQALGLLAALGLVAASSERSRRPVWLLLVAATITLWLFRNFKIYDTATSVALVAALAWLAASPRPGRHFLAGVALGLAAVFGRNHGVYGIAGYLTLVALQRHDPAYGNGGWRRTTLAWIGGMVVGFLPVLALLAFCPGFALKFWESIRMLFEYKATNLPLPVPWPWLALDSSLPLKTISRNILWGSLFVGLLAGGTGGLIWAARRTWQKKPIAPAQLACIVLILPYAHYAFSRADYEHLACGIFPLLLGLLLWLANRPFWLRWAGGGTLVAISLWITLPEHPGFQSRWKRWDKWTQVGRDNVLMPSDFIFTKDTELIDSLVARFAPDGQNFLATPWWPGAYALSGRKSPVYDIYSLFPRSEAFQRQEIARIQAAAPAFVLLHDLTLDNREDLRFSRTNPLITRFLHENFTSVTDLELPTDYFVLVPRSIRAAPTAPAQLQ